MKKISKKAKKSSAKKALKKAPVKKAAGKKQAAKKQEKQAITRKMLLVDLAQKYPEAAGALFSRGLHCIGCGMSAFETIEQGCQTHGMSDKEIDEMILEMNKTVKKK